MGVSKKSGFLLIGVLVALAQLADWAAGQTMAWNRTQKTLSIMTDLWVQVKDGQTDQVYEQQNTTTADTIGVDHTVAASGGSPQTGSGTASARLTDHWSTLNPNNQAVLGWDFSFSQDFVIELTGGSNGYSGTASNRGNSYVQTAAVLTYPDPNAQTYSRLRVEVGWTGNQENAASYPFVKGISGDVWIGPSVHVNFSGVTVTGWDGGMEPSLFKAATAPADSDTGSLGVGLGEFVHPLAVGTVATMNLTATSSAWVMPVSVDPNQSKRYYRGNLFSGAIEVWADEP